MTKLVFEPWMQTGSELLLVSNPRDGELFGLKWRKILQVSNIIFPEDMILALAGQFKQLSHEPEKFR